MITPNLDEVDIFNAALALKASDDRSLYVQQACAGDVARQARIEAMLRLHDREPSYLEPPSEDSGTPGEAPLAAELGAQIGQYKLLRKIGEGGMGTVFIAEQNQPVKRTVAVKIIKAGMDSRRVIGRFEAERQALALMDHPNIARVLDAGTADSSRPFFVMELVEGIPITKYCDQHRLTPRERLQLFVPVCQAVQHAHQKGIVHRDLKPTNVLVARYDERAVPKIIDFGVAKAVGTGFPERTELTEFGSVIGTLEYMSPEQAEPGQPDIDTRSDIYSLGALLYELLTGTTPLQPKRLHGAALLELLRVVREEEPPTPSSRLSTTEELPSIAANRHLEPKKLSGLVRGDLDWIVMKCLEKDRTRRYETANGLARDLERFLHDEPVEARSPSAGYRLRKFTRRHRKMLATAAAFVLLLIVGATVSTWQAVRATAERDAKEEARQAEAGQRRQAVAEKQRADEEAAIAKAVNEFLQHDLLGQADIGNQPAGAERNKNITVRELLDRAAENVRAKFKGQELTEAAIRLTLGNAYRAIGEYPEAQKHLERSLELRKQKLGAKNPDTLRGASSLADLLRNRGQFSEAEQLYKAVLDARRAELSADHPDTLQAMNNLGMLYHDRGQYDEAESLLKPALDRRKITLGVDHLDTLESMSNLALLYWSRGQHFKAEPLWKQSLDGFRARRGPDHPDTLIVMQDLAVLYESGGRFDEAEPLFKQVLETLQAKRSADHPDTLTAMNNLAVLYQKRRRYDESEGLLNEVLQGRRSKLGPENPDTLTTLQNLATCYVYKGQFDQAEPLFKKVIDAQRRILSAENPSTIISLNNLAVFYRDRGRYVEAEALFTEALAGARKKLGLGHAITHSVVGNLCMLYSKQGRPHLSEPLFRELAAFLREIEGADSLLYANQLAALSLVLLEQMKYVEAEPIARECLAIRMKKRPDGWSPFFSRSLLGRALLGQKKYAEAEPLLVEGYEGMKQRESQIRQDSRMYHTQTLERLVQLYDAWGKPEMAAQWRAKLAADKAKPKP